MENIPSTREDEKKKIFDPKLSDKSNGSAQVTLSAPVKQWAELHGFINNGRLMIGLPLWGGFLCPNGHSWMYFLKRDQDHPQYCVVCGAKFE